jgi:hypothetical protein
MAVHVKITVVLYVMNFSLIDDSDSKESGATICRL